MWLITVRSPEGEPQEIILKPGLNTVGRQRGNDIIVPDASASRRHAEIVLNERGTKALITDLGSTNGTYLNRRKLADSLSLADGDIIRIGTCLMTVQVQAQQAGETRIERTSGTRPLTREMLLESFDSHAVLLYDIARQFNSLVDMAETLDLVTDRIKLAMGADACRILLADQIDDLEAIIFPHAIIRTAVNQRSAVVVPDLAAAADAGLRDSAGAHRIRSALCAPIQSPDETLLGVIYMYKTDPHSRPLSTADIPQVVAICHMAALTMERVHLVERIRKEQSIRETLQRFVAPSRFEEFWEDYLENDALPGLRRRDATILFTDISDSTGLAERIGTQRFGELLSMYYRQMTEIIFKHGGMVNKYLGDGVMAVFGVSDRDLNPEVGAIRAGLEMIEAISQSSYPDIEIFQIGVGVNSGPVMAGYVGARDHMEYTVVGDTVNVAARLEGLSRPNRLFIGPITRAAISSEFESDRMGEMQIRGRTAPIQVYQVLGG